MRYEYIDLARALAILSVISWHLIGSHTIWTDGWVMPIFFIIMGIFYRQPSSFTNLCSKKFRTILFPHLVFSIPALLLALYNEGLHNTIKILLNPYKCINSSSWFLVAMFSCYLIYWFINYVSKGNSFYRLIISFFISLFGFYSSQEFIEGHRIVLPFFISTSLTVTFFIEIGKIATEFFLEESEGGVKFTIL